MAALIANGEDVLNSPSWRDALHESQMIGLASRMRSSASGRRIGADRSEHTRVNIRWYAIPNENKTQGRASGGFLPMIEEDGKPRGSTWASRGLEKAEAEAQAEAWAHDAASRFLGDFNVVVEKGRPR
jgi:hypothetical protein